MTHHRPFTRKKNGKVLLGLCAGLADYFKIDPLLVRLLFIAGLFLLETGLALILIYFIAALVAPYESKTSLTEN